ncbi:hypothetical protein CISIN_1g0130041mg, partial [Citrus sinensis]
ADQSSKTILRRL